ncbi:Bug family tripartite tricarboxylate transporter substrate binding protein [Sediminicoccus rosea]|uniref:Tripartite tricarboxylate transporter substrate binding protein n=1 Tax=Sediminicoccus rosea TaxID=1225128 RepID=A0ABZ0PLZ9_9PROT|nr:tripartite tricarboxylate transporter substrate binding protein [Sediminicoccus rosea]WPB86764.1 tripartite tricarboxylate transporter substrate binding protein [Sediminicoccus rosea]
MPIELLRRAAVARRAALALPALILARPAAAQDYPSRPVRVVIGFPPGGGVDIVARLIMPRLSEALGQPFLVENRAGANGNIAMDAVHQSSPDGYTLFYGNVGNLAVTNALYRNLSFDTLRDFVPIGQTMESFSVIAVNAELPIRTLPELMAYARANPGRLNGASAGAGGPTHLALELFKRQFNLDIVHVPYRGSAPAIVDLAGGRVQLIIDGYSLMRSAVESGRVRVLAVAAARREALLPNIPTTAEAGAPGFEAGSWHMLTAPRGTPQAALDRLERALGAALAEPALVAAMAQQGVAARFRNQRDAAAFFAAERERWTRVIREGNITVE